jgi:hypothetical protein
MLALRPRSASTMTNLQTIFWRLALLICLGSFPAWAQETQFFPEVDAHLTLNSTFRAYLEAKDDRDGGDPTQFALGPSLQIYLKPLIKLKKVTQFDLDDSKSRFLVLETGYRYITAPGATGDTNGGSGNLELSLTGGVFSV